MSVDEFDPAIERGYRRAPDFADSALFTAEVEARTYRRQRKRRLMIGGFGTVACALFMQQIVRINMDSLTRNGVAETIVPRQQVGNVMDVLANLATRAGIDDVAVAGISAPQMLLLCGVGVATLLAGTAVRLSQSL